PAAAVCEVGFFSTARLIASANVIRSAGAGVCACPVEQRSMEQTRTPGVKPRTTGRYLTRRFGPSGLTTPANALDDDIQHRNERQIEERRGDHAARDGRADRVPRLAAR